MKSLIAALALVSTSAFGSVVGHIHFQKASTWVNAYYSKSLCFNGTEFEAVVTKCMKYGQGDERPCLKYGKIKAVQPQESTRQRCADFAGGDGDCQRWETVRYFQSENILVKFYDQNDNLVRTENITVPSCN